MWRRLTFCLTFLGISVSALTCAWNVAVAAGAPSAVTISGVNPSTSVQEIEWRFGKPESSFQDFDIYVRGKEYVTIHRNANGRREVEGVQLEVNGNVVARVDGQLTLAAVEDLLGYRATHLAIEKNAEWFEFPQHSLRVTVGTHSPTTGKILAFYLFLRRDR